MTGTSRILCAISGIEYKVEHMQMYLTSRESHHPIFDIPTNRLLTMTPRWLQGELTHTENYLLYLSLFNSTGLMEFRVPATVCADTASVIAQNMDRLANIVERINNTGHVRATNVLHLPSFAITSDTKDLTSSPDWITIWENCYADYAENYKSATLLEKLERQETILERWIRDNTKEVSEYASRLANWAHDAGKFEQYAGFDIMNENNQLEQLSSYWKRVIIACAKTESIWEVPDEDIQEIITHCEEHIHHGTIHAHTLMSLLRAGAARKKNYLDLGDIDVGSNGVSFRILDANASIEDANKIALINSAPIDKPIESKYPNKLAYLKAKLNYQMAQDYKQSQAIHDQVQQVAGITGTTVGKESAP